MPEGVADYIAQTCMENVVSGHRAEIFLYYATRAYAAYSGDKTASTNHVDTVAPLVLLHRRRDVVPPEEEAPHEHDQERNENNRLPNPTIVQMKNRPVVTILRNTIRSNRLDPMKTMIAVRKYPLVRLP